MQLNSVEFSQSVLSIYSLSRLDLARGALVRGRVNRREIRQVTAATSEVGP